jgi:RHS repeat-associated protein
VGAAANDFLLTDQVGTLRAVADTSGNIVKRIDYDSFGNIIADSNPAFSVPFGFAGGLHDRDTGLVRFGYRDYSPELRRFVAKDPIDFAGGDTNLYAYVMNDPVNWIDPEGLRWWAGAGKVRNKSSYPITVTGDKMGGGEASVVIPPGGTHNFNRDWTGAVCDSVRKRSLDPFRDFLLDPDHVQGPHDKERRKIQPWPWTTIEYESPGSGSW